jgi:hypothetical protein
VLSGQVPTDNTGDGAKKIIDGGAEAGADIERTRGISGDGSDDSIGESRRRRNAGLLPIAIDQ